MLCYGVLTTRKEMSKMSRMVDLIRANKKISKVQLVIQTHISISYYEKLKPFMEELFSQSIRYNSVDRMWESIEVETVEPTA